MKHSHSSVTVSEALRQVFQLYPQARSQQYPQSLPSLCRTPFRPSLSWRSPPIHRLIRSASTSRMGGYMASVNDTRIEPKRSDRPPRDEEIKAFRICLVQPENSRLSEPISLHDVLESRQRDDKGRLTQFLQQVAPANPREDRLYAVCKMFDKKAAREAEILKKKSSKEKKIQMKQLEISWTVSENDLSYRLERFKEFLGKGWRVAVVFGAKRKGWMEKREPTAEEVQYVLGRIRGAVKEVEGATELKMQGTVGGEATFSFEGKLKKS